MADPCRREGGRTPPSLPDIGCQLAPRRQQPQDADVRSVNVSDSAYEDQLFAGFSVVPGRPAASARPGARLF